MVALFNNIGFFGSEGTIGHQRQEMPTEDRYCPYPQLSSVRNCIPWERCRFRETTYHSHL